ncbi:MAG: MBOAT family protein, partial [Muribaculaceae bacterium]|nr:MBOAT family protein [Muribaculaceae bacterium]
GFHFNENFNHPYCCNSITDFWRRWHISLGSFFRDYVYIPLGGNRHHQVINILIVWFLTGMWHGASWNFILWGVYFGIIVMLEKYTLLRVINKIPAPFLHLYSLTIVVFGWGLFYFESLDNLHIFVNSFFGNTTIASDIVEESAFFNNFWLWIVAIIFSMPTRTYASNLLSRSISNENAVAWVRLSSRIVISLSILILSVALLVGATNNAFIYTRF